MSEEYITITDLLAGQKFFLNKKEYTADESGCVFLSESMMKGEKGTPMQLFESKIADTINDLCKMQFYRMCGRSSSVVLGSVINAMEGNRVLARQVLAMGEFCGVLSRGHNYTWKVNSKLMKERMLVLEDRLAKMIQVKAEEPTGDEFRKQVLNEYVQPLERVMMAQHESQPNEKPVVPTKEKPDLSKPLASVRKPR